MQNNSHEIARQIRQQFFVFRNGLLADNLRNSGDCHKMIFGLNLIQIVDIAKQFNKDELVANELWKSKDTRECRLIAPMLYPTESFSEDIAMQWISGIENHEIADNLCHKLLRNTSFAAQLCNKLTMGNEIEQYVSMRLATNLLIINKAIDIDTLKIFAESQLSSKSIHTLSVAKGLLEAISDLE